MKQDIPDRFLWPTSCDVGVTQSRPYPLGKKWFHPDPWINREIRVPNGKIDGAAQKLNWATCRHSSAAKGWSLAAVAVLISACWQRRMQ
jgi:hypothetical protein